MTTENKVARILGLRFDRTYLEGKIAAAEIDLRALKNELTRIETEIAILRATDRKAAANR